MLLSRSCPGCGGRSPSGPGGGLCPACLARGSVVGEIRGLPGLDRCGAPFRYRGPVKRALVAAKYRSRRDVLGQFGRSLSELARDMDLGFDVVTWVPASRAGRRGRGYDQGRMLAVAVARRSGVPARRLLTRERRDGQTGRDRASRLAGPLLVSRSPVAGGAVGRVLVVDDVITTGTSMAAAGAALRQAGASAVYGLAVAWTASAEEVAVGRPLGPGLACGPGSRWGRG